MTKRRVTKQPKIDPETLEELEDTNQELDTKQAEVEINFEHMINSFVNSYRVDVENFCRKNPEIAGIRLMQYVDSTIPRETQIKEEKQDSKLKEERLNLPDIIHIKKGGLRHPKPSEIMFSLNGTPIVVERPRTTVRAMFIESNAMSNPDLLTSDIQEVD